MRLIPGKTKVQIELFRGITLSDLAIALVAILLIVFVLTSSLPGQLFFVLGIVLIAAALLVRLDSEPNYIYLLHILRHFGYKRSFKRSVSDDVLTGKTSSGEGAEAEPAAPVETAEQRKARLKAEREEYAADEKKLKSHKLTKEEEDAIWLKRANQSAARKQERQQKKTSGDSSSTADMTQITAFTDIKDDFIEYNGEYVGAAIQIEPVEFRFFSEYRRANTIENCLGRVLRSLPADYAANIVKIERPVIYDQYLKNEQDKIDELRAAYEKGTIAEDELQSRVEVLFDRIYDLQDICFDHKVIEPAYYLVLFDSDRQQLNNAVSGALDLLHNGEMKAHRLNSAELAVFLKYTNSLDFDEREVSRLTPDQYAAWAMPESLLMNPRTVIVNGIVTHNLRVTSYPAQVDDAWLATVMSMPATKVVVKTKPMDRERAVRGIDRSLQELRGQFAATGIDSKRIELQEHIDTLSSLLTTLQGDNETLLEVNVYITGYDIVNTRAQAGEKGKDIKSSIVGINNMKRSIRRTWQEQGMKLNGLEFDQVNAYIASQISAYDPMSRQGRGMPSNSVAAAYPWVFAHISDPKGIKLGTSDGVPVFIDFFRRDSERVNSNMVIVGKSGSGKSYATKSLLTNLAADDSKIFILDPENEYTELAANLHGQFINVGNASNGRLNPFHIITGLDDEESEGGASGSYATHLQFLEEFFRQVLPDCDKDAMEYLNSLIDRMYTNMGITSETDLSALTPEDYPTFDDLYDAVLNEFQSTDNEYIHTMLRTLMNYIAKFSSGGRNAVIWNGPSSVTTDENFTVFNFQSLLANRNGSIANAQMLLVLKYIDNEIIKNRDYNIRHKMNRKIVVVIDEAHVFIDTKYPAALDFMFQLAKRIRKYNGMQIVITQNIKDFVGSEEIARKSTAIINACQYSFIFALAPNDMDDLCKLYEKAGGINENEQEQIVSAQRGQAFTVMSPQSRSSFKIVVPDDVVSMFSDPDHESNYFAGDDGRKKWNDFLGDSRILHNTSEEAMRKENPIKSKKTGKSNRVTFMEIDEDEYAEEMAKRAAEQAAKAQKNAQNLPAPKPDLEDDFDLPDIFIPDDPEEFARMKAQTGAQGEEPAGSGSKLSDLLDRFTYEGMLQEIRRSVREELEKEIAERGGLAVLPGDDEDDLEMPDFTDISSLLDDDDTDSSAAKARSDSPFDDLFGTDETDDASGTAGTADAAGAEEDTVGTFDIMQMLMQAADDMSTLSPLETMVEYDEQVLEITLEELMQYNAARL